MPAPFRWITAPFRRRSRQQEPAAWEDQDIIALATALYTERPDPPPSASNNNHQGDSSGFAAVEPAQQEPMDETPERPATGEAGDEHAADAAAQTESAAAPGAPAEAETGAVLVDPLQRARAALEDARRQMPSMLGLAEEPAAPLRPERTAIVPAQETRLAEWNALLQELVQERRSLAAEIGALRGLVLELRGEVERLNDMLAAPDSAAPAAPAPTDLAPAEAPSAAPAEAGDALAALAQLDVAAADETVPAGHGLEVNVRLLAEIEERLARGFTGEPARPTPPSWMERSIWRLPVNAPAAAADERAPAPAAAISTPSEATPAEQPEDAGGDEQAPARPGAATPEAATDPEAATLPLQPRLPAGPVVRDFGWRVHPDALEDRLPESWHRHAAVASVPAPATPSHTTPAEAAPLALLIGPVAGIKRLAALERRLASAAAVQRLELATFRGGDALFRVRLRPGAAPEALLDSVGDEDASVGDYILTEDRRSLTVRLQAVAPPAGAS